MYIVFFLVTSNSETLNLLAKLTAKHEELEREQMKVSV